MKEQTLVLIKPDAVRKNVVGKIISMYEVNGLVINSCKTITTDKSILFKHYEEHVGKDFFESLLAFMNNEKIFVLIIEGEDAIERARKINGATDPNKSSGNTIRKLFGTDIQKNAVHGSASKEEAVREINIWFGDNNGK